MRSPRQSHYRVKRGDTLSKIALAEYHDAGVWPDVAKANHIPNGNVILIGMHLKLPTLPPAPHGAGASHPAKTSAPVHHAPVHHAPVHHAPMVGPPRPGAGVPAPHVVNHGGLAGLPDARAVAFPAVKYKLDGMAPLVVMTPQADYKIKLVGEVTIQQKGTMAEVEFSSTGGMSQKLKAEYDSKLVKLADQVKVKWDFLSLKAEVSCGFTMATKINGQEFVSHQYDYIPPNRFKYTLKPKEVSGEIENVLFKGNIGYELEITAKTNAGRQAGAPIPVPAPSQSTQMAWVIAGMLVLAGVAIIVADLAKDVGTLGAGAVESPMSFAAAMALFTRAGQLAH